MIENVDFICEVFRYKAQAEEFMQNSTAVASDEMKTEAMALYYQYIQTNSPDEVNVSAATRDVVKKQFDQWKPNSNLISKDIARKDLEGDILRRVLVFEPAYREILVMLYQNLWTKFQVAEATAFALQEDNAPESSSIFPMTLSRPSIIQHDKNEKEVLKPVPSGKDHPKTPPMSNKDMSSKEANILKIKPSTTKITSIASVSLSDSITAQFE